MCVFGGLAGVRGTPPVDSQGRDGRRCCWGAIGSKGEYVNSTLRWQRVFVMRAIGCSSWVLPSYSFGDMQHAAAASCCIWTTGRTAAQLSATSSGRTHKLTIRGRGVGLVLHAYDAALVRFAAGLLHVFLPPGNECCVLLFIVW